MGGMSGGMGGMSGGMGGMDGGMDGAVGGSIGSGSSGIPECCNQEGAEADKCCMAYGNGLANKLDNDFAQDKKTDAEIKQVLGGLGASGGKKVLLGQQREF